MTAEGLAWRRTWPDKPFDFVLERDGKTLARIYRHHDGPKWQWFWQVIPARSGLAASRQEAIDAVLAIAQERAP